MEMEYYSQRVDHDAERLVLDERELYVGRPGVFSGIDSVNPAEVRSVCHRKLRFRMLLCIVTIRTALTVRSVPSTPVVSFDSHPF